jgi:hypothetical protein
MWIVASSMNFMICEVRTLPTGSPFRGLFHSKSTGFAGDFEDY